MTILVPIKKIARSKERPPEFEINYWHPLAKGLVFAGLGRHTKTTYFHDSSLYGNHGTLTNMEPATDLVRELGRAALEFASASSQYVIAPTCVNDSATTFSAFCWVKWSGTQNQYVFGRYQTTTNNRAWAIATSQSVWGGGADGSQPSVIISTDGTLSAGKYKIYWINQSVTGQWRHFGFTWYSGALTLYLDGIAQTPVKDTDGAFTAMKVAAASLSLGCVNSDTGGSAFFNGPVADPIVANRALSPSEISALADPGNVMYSLGGSDPGLLRYSPTVKQFSFITSTSPYLQRKYLVLSSSSSSSSSSLSKIILSKKISRPKERPAEFEIDYSHPLSKGLVFAGLGRHTKTTYFHDSSLYGNHGALTNMTPSSDWVRDLGRAALDFDGSDDAIDLPQSIDDLIPSTFTFACWLRPAFDLDAVADSAANDKIIFGKYTSDAVYAGGFLWKLDTDSNKTQLACWDNSSTLVANTFGAKTAWNANEWYYLAVSWNGVGYSHWVNGLCDLYTADSDRFGTTNQTLFIAKAPAVTLFPQPLQARITDFCIWSRVLSPSEISALADPGNVMLSLGDSDPGLLRYSPRIKQFTIFNIPSTKKRYLTIMKKIN